jgi:N4-gp56 family major capsid protein
MRMALIPLMKFRQFTDEKEGWGMHKGDTLYFDKASLVDTAGGTLVETNTMPENQFSIGRGTITLSEWGNSIPWTGKLEALDQLNALGNTVNKVLRQDMAQVLDKACGINFKQSWVKYICKSSNSGNFETRAADATLASVASNLAKYNPTVYHIQECVDWLRRENIPPYDDEDYVGIFSVNALRGIYDDGAFQDAAKYGDPERLFSGEVGRIYNCRCIRETNYLVNTLGSSSGTNALGEGVIFGEETVMEGIAIPEELRQKIPTDYGRSKGLAWYGILGWERVWKQSDTNQTEHIIHLTSAK